MINMTLPYSAKKKCIVKMGPRQVTVSSACLCPHTQTTRVISVGDIIKCLSAGAQVKEIINDKSETETLNHKTATFIFSEEHLEYLKKFNTNIRTPEMQRDSYLIDTPAAPIKTEIKKEEVVVTSTVVEETPVVNEVTVEEPSTPDVVVELTTAEEVTPVEEVNDEVVSTEETPVEEQPEEVEAVEEEVEEPKHNYNNKKNKNRR